MGTGKSDLANFSVWKARIRGVLKLLESHYFCSVWKISELGIVPAALTDRPDEHILILRLYGFTKPSRKRGSQFGILNHRRAGQRASIIIVAKAIAWYNISENG